MAARLKLYVDWFNKTLVKGLNNSGTFTLPKFYQGDVVPMQIYIVEPDPDQTSKYTQVDISGMGLKLAVDEQPVGNAASTPFVTQFTWSKNTVENDYYFYADVAFNTADLTSFLGSNTSRTDAYFELEITESSAVTTIYQSAITIVADVVDAATDAVPAGQTPLSLEIALQMFPKKLMDPGDSITFVSKDGLKRTIVYTDNDGSHHTDAM